jgi:hypothetical protein
MATSPSKSSLPTCALRCYGPRVFISYSFADSTVAKQLEASLVAKGFQVRREDDTSLFNEKLTEAIPRRMADAEVFVQLLTTASNRSAWVERELDWMFEHRQAGTGIVFLPVVFDKSTLPERVKEWWFLDLADGKLTDEAIEAIERLCVKSLHLLRLADDDPLGVRESDLEKVLTEVPKDGRRVILDSDGKLLRWSHETLAFAETIDSEYRDAFLAQQRLRHDRLITRLKIRDEVTRKLVLEVMREMKAYTSQPIKDAMLPMKHFFQIILGDLALAAAEVGPPEPHPLRNEYKDRIEAARAASTENHSPGFMNPGLYAWVFGEKGGEDDLVRMDMVAPGFRTISVQIPRRVFGNMADIYTRSAITFNPVQELLSGTFINYVLPQIAINAAYNLIEPATVRKDLDEKYAWRLDQYNLMGLS